MNKNILLLTCAVVLLSTTTNSFASKTTDYECSAPSASVKIKIAYPDTDTAIMLYEGDEIISMKNVVGASGATYVGEGWKWSVKNEEGLLSVVDDKGNETGKNQVIMNCKAK